MALMVLAAEWCHSQGVRCSVITIDHDLRAGSADETIFVARQAEKLGLSHRVGRWHERVDGGNLQQKARVARYRLIDEMREGADVVLMAHTLEDQAETVLMRLRRPAGIDGLAGIPQKRRVFSQQGDFWLLRPLLKSSGVRLRAFLSDQAVDWVEDPSNSDRKYERVRMRQHLSELARQGITAQDLSNIAAKMAKSKMQLDAQVHQVAEMLTEEYSGDLRLRLSAFCGLPSLLQKRLFSKALCWVSANPYPPRQAARDQALDLLLLGKAQTLHGCLMFLWKNCLYITREAQAIAAEPVALRPKMLWDKRWRLTMSQTLASDALWVTALGPTEAAKLRPHLDIDLPFKALVAQPAIFDQTGFLCAPALRPHSGLQAQIWPRDFIESLRPY